MLRQTEFAGFGAGGPNGNLQPAFFRTNDRISSSSRAAYGYEGKGILIHLPADAAGTPMPAAMAPVDGDERKRLEHLLEMIEVKTGRPPKKINRTAGDKGHDPRNLREFLLGKGIQPQIPGKLATALIAARISARK